MQSVFFGEFILETVGRVSSASVVEQHNFDLNHRLCPEVIVRVFVLM